MHYTAFSEPKWDWVGIDEGDTFSPLMSPDVRIMVVDDILHAQVNVPGEFHHYVDSIHGGDTDITGFELERRERNRWYFWYSFVTPADSGNRCLWYWTQADLPGWARQVLRGVL